MTRKIALGSDGPLSGKTTLSTHLQNVYGFQVVSHSLSVARSFVERYNSIHPDRPITVEEVYQNKEYYRPALQQHGYDIGFNSPELTEYWVDFTLSTWDGKSDVVFDCWRGEGQTQVLRDKGFTIVQLHISELERMHRADEKGVDYVQIVESMNAMPELEMGVAHPDITLDAQKPTDVQARIILDRPEKTIGYHIFGSTVHPRC